MTLAAYTKKLVYFLLFSIYNLLTCLERQKELERLNYQKINKIKEEAESHIIDIQASVQHYIQEQNDKLIITAQKINQVIPEKQKVFFSYSI